MNKLTDENLKTFRVERKEIPHYRFGLLYRLLQQPVKRVLDIGCWNRELLEMFPSETEKHGLDLVARDFGPSIHFRVADISEGLPYPDNFFTAVIAGEIIEHLMEPARFLKDIFRILDANGQLILTTPNLSYWRNAIQLIKSDNFFWVDYDFNQNGHVRYFSPKTIRKMLRKNGFKVKKLFSIDDVRGTILLNLIGNLFKSFSSRHNMNLVVYCIKQ